MCVRAEDSPQEHHPSLKRQDLTLVWSSSIRLDWLASESQGSSCLYYPSAEIPSRHHHALYCYVCSGNQTILMLAVQTLYQQSYLSSPSFS